jgi:hypothetical protein
MDSVLISFNSPRVILSISSGVRLFFRSNIAPCPKCLEPSPQGADRAGAARRQAAARATIAKLPKIIVLFIFNQPQYLLYFNKSHSFYPFFKSGQNSSAG